MRISIFKYFFYSALVIVVISPTTIFAQDTTDNSKFGLSASLQDNQFDIIIPYRYSKSIVFAPAFSFINIEDTGSDIGIGFIWRYYFKTKKVSPFLGTRFAALIASPDNGDSTTDYIFGISFGGEYFLDDNFSFGLETQLNAAKSDESSMRFNTPDLLKINTATSIFATIYF